MNKFNFHSTDALRWTGKIIVYQPGNDQIDRCAVIIRYWCDDIVSALTEGMMHAKHQIQRN